jgi:hypothetical protein
MSICIEPRHGDPERLAWRLRYITQIRSELAMYQAEELEYIKHLIKNLDFEAAKKRYQECFGISAYEANKAVNQLATELKGGK